MSIVSSNLSFFDLVSAKTVKPTYSWDAGIPLIDKTIELTTQLSSMSSSYQNEDGVQYVGYSPYMQVNVSSLFGELDDKFLALKQTINFGDYYNSETNTITKNTPCSDPFCHVYIMPGVYTIELDVIEYTATNKGETNEGIYIESRGNELINPLSSQWINYNCDHSGILWLSSGFQQANQLTWKDVYGPCAFIQTNWKWEDNVCILNTWDQLSTSITWTSAENLCLDDINWRWENSCPVKIATTWDDTRCCEPARTSWNYTSQSCANELNFSPTVTHSKITKTAVVRVIEIPPTAYLDVVDLGDRVLPLTVKLTPKNIISGSFPIEKIIWDLGDGSPLLVQRRWANTLEKPFVYSNNLPDDYEDPRNYDVIHTYTNLPESGVCFYPSITAYCSSTGTSDCASVIVGPLKLPTTNGTNVEIIQTELSEHGKLLMGQVDNNLAIWRIDK